VKRSTAAALFAILLLAVLMRLLPLLRSLYWGSDFGEYYALTQSLAESGTLPTDYRGWGVTYPDFPGLYAVNAAFVVSGMPADAAVSLVVPLVAGFAVLPLFLLAARVARDDLAGLVAAAFLAVAMPHVYATSHVTPASLGDFLLVGALLMFVGLRRSPKLFAPLLLAGLAIVVTHHLAAYVLVLAAASALLLRAVLDAKLTVRAVRLELAFLALLLAATLAFWTTYASSLWSIIAREASVPAYALAVGAAALVLLVPLVIVLRRRTAWRFRPRARSARGAGFAAGLAATTAFAIVGVATIVPVAGTTIRLSLVTPLLFAPFFAFLGFAAAGRKTMDFSREGTDVTAWFLALVLSIVFGALAAPEVLIPYRHIEYVVIPLAVMVGAGWRWLTMSEGARGQIAAGGVALLLVAGTAASALPTRDAIVGFQEGISPRTVEAALWVREHGYGLVAGDHRLSTVLFGVGGVDATWDRAGDLWHTEEVNATLAAMASVPVVDGVTRVSWVVIDVDLRAGVQTSPFAPASPLLPAEAAKFATTPFQKAFDSGFAQVYLVNWGLAP
jgi:hypothetical protein